MHFHDGVKNISNFQHILDYSVPGVTHKDFLPKMSKVFDKKEKRNEKREKLSTGKYGFLWK